MFSIFDTILSSMLNIYELRCPTVQKFGVFERSLLCSPYATSIWWKYSTFTFMHLADAFIQSDLQLYSGYTFFVSTCVPWELNPQPFALLTQCSTTEPHWNTDIVTFYFNLYLYEYIFKKYFFPVVLSWISCSHYFSLQCHMILQECLVFAYYQCFFGKCDSYIYLYIFF